MSTSFKDLLKKISSMSFEPLDLFGQQKKNKAVSEAGELCHALLELKGESASYLISGKVLKTYEAFDPEEKCSFFHLLLEKFSPDPEQIAEAIQDYQQQADQHTLQALAGAVESPRQELFRILNIASGGTMSLINMRGDLLRLLPEHPELKVVNEDLRHLFRSWFNRGFLELRRIDWHTPALVLEKLIEYESVHEIKGWPDLRRRLDADRRCFGFFHPAIPETPLIFVEVALTNEMSGNISALLDHPVSTNGKTNGESGENGENGENGNNFSTAVFFSINNCLRGLKGISFGNFLIKQVVSSLSAEFPKISTYTTLSPVPGFMQWLRGQLQNDSSDFIDAPQRQALQDLITTPELLLEQEKDFKSLLLSLCARYLRQAKSRGKPADPVARFHLGNGARLERINWMADRSENGLSQSAGIMVNYLYDQREMISNHEAYEQQDKVVCSNEVSKLAKET